DVGAGGTDTMDSGQAMSRATGSSRKRCDFPSAECPAIETNIVERSDETLALEIAEGIEVTPELNGIGFGKIVRDRRRACAGCVHVDGQRAREATDRDVIPCSRDDDLIRVERTAHAGVKLWLVGHAVDF